MKFAIARWIAGGLLIATPLQVGCRESEAPKPREERASVGCSTCTVLRGGMVFDGSRSGPGVVVIEGDRIKEVVFGDPPVSAGHVVDVGGKTVLPGLIDLHVHTMSESGPLGDFSQQSHLSEHLKAMLRSGVTSYLDLGSPEHVIFDVRARVRSGMMLAPRVFAVGPLLTPTGGHPCYAGSPPGDFCVFVDAPSDAAPKVASLAAQRPDLVKIVVEAGQSKPLPRMAAETMAAITRAAGEEKLSVIAHVSSVHDVEDALDAGVRLFAHIPSEERVTPALAHRLAESGAVVVPTLAVMDGFYRVSHGETSAIDDPSLLADVPADVLSALHDPAKLASMKTPAYQAMTAAWRDNANANLGILREAGVVFATGTDAGNPSVFHGLAMRRELALYVEAGMSTEEALTAATRNAANVLGRSDLGRLEAGALADVIVVDGDALADIEAVSRVERVYREGALVDIASLALPNKTSLELTPARGVDSGDTCLSTAECGPKMSCDQDLVCAPVCHGFTGCAKGSACLGGSASSTCYQGDGCNAITQDCENGAACVPLGNAATACWYAGTAGVGKACGPGGLCQRGAVCDFASNRCKAICDPDGLSGTPCPAGKECVDYSAAAGLPLGECE